MTRVRSPATAFLFFDLPFNQYLRRWRGKYEPAIKRPAIFLPALTRLSVYGGFSENQLPRLVLQRVPPFILNILCGPVLFFLPMTRAQLKEEADASLEIISIGSLYSGHIGTRSTGAALGFVFDLFCPAYSDLYVCCN